MNSKNHLNTSKLVTTAYSIPHGWWLNVTYDEQFVYQAHLSTQPDASLTGNYALEEKIRQELANYFSNPHHRFNLELRPFGTPYQQKVWNALIAIPVGQTLTYGELAQRLHSGPRAIGQACRTNPLALFIPCHRIVGKDSLGGFMGKEKGLNFKQQLINHEKTNL